MASHIAVCVCMQANLGQLYKWGLGFLSVK